VLHLAVPVTCLFCTTCRERFGWDQAKTDDLLLPVIRSYLDRSTQTRIDQFLTHSQRFAKIRSKRMQQAVARITGVEVNPDLYYAETRHLPELPKHTADEDADADEQGAVADEAGDDAGAAAAVGTDEKGARGAAAGGGRGRGRGRKASAAAVTARGVRNGSAGRSGGRRGRGQGRGRATALEAEQEQEDEDVGSAHADLDFMKLVM
jgi:GTP cyclohydrolase III